MKDGFRQTMAFLHSWAGLIPGWLLYAVFLTGTISYYRQEITQWMRPELSGAVADPQAAAHALAFLEREGAEAALWRIDLPTTRNPVTEVLWKGEQGGFQSQELDPRTGGPLEARKTAGGDFLYYFHFDLRAPWRLGRWLICFATVVMLVAIISGVITHRRIFADFFTFRPRKGQRSWLDAHNVLGVAALPFHLMISFTGLVTLATMFLPWAIQQAYPGDSAAYAQELAGHGAILEHTQPVEARVGPAALGAMAGEAHRLWQGGTVGRILIDRPMSDTALVTVERRDSDRISYDRAWLRFTAEGRLIASYDGGGAAVTTHGWLYGLHLARFSDPALRALFFLSGLLGTAMIATGLILWVVKRRPRDPAFSPPHVAERINVAVIAGLPLAIAALLLANRLLPVALPGRAVWEMAAFFLAWLAAIVHASCIRPGRAWRSQLLCIAVLCLASPVAALFTTPGLPAWIAAGDTARSAIDLTLILIGLAILTLLLRRRPRRAA